MDDTQKIIALGAVIAFYSGLAQLARQMPILINPSIQFTSSQRREFGIRCNSMVNSVVLSVLSFYLLQTLEFQSRLFDYEPAVVFLLCLASGYFIWDTIDVVLNIKDSGLGFFFHGFSCSILYTYALFTQTLFYYSITFLLFELSTPFLNLMWFSSTFAELAQIKLPSHIPNFFRVAFALTFLVARVMMGPYWSSLFWIDAYNLYLEPDSRAPASFLTMSYLFLLLNIGVNFPNY